ncbi:MAG: DNA polymerase I [Proteobacteria bacterium]|nr:DNA polymerase I [Pseudomonadota bacterium]
MSNEQLNLLGIPAKEAAPKKKARKKPASRHKAAPSARNTTAPRPDGAKPTMYLVDGPNIAFRAHYAPMAALNTARGFPTKALYGYVSMLLKLFRENNPDYLCLCWDPRGGTFRNQIYDEYKGTRPDMPDELRVQLDRFPEAADALNLAHIVVPGYEADDVIGTLAMRHKETHDIVIVSGDKDLMSLVDGTSVTMYDTMKELRIGPEQVKQRWGVPPEHIADMLALMGDSSDNIPGVARIGKKGAADLVAEFGTIENIFANAENVKGRNKKPLLAEGAFESAQLSKELATLALNVEVPVTLEDLKFEFPPKDVKAVTAMFTELEFHRFLDEIGGQMKSLTADRYRIAAEPLEMRLLIDDLRKQDVIALELKTDTRDGNKAELLGIALCAHASESWYVPLDGELDADTALLYLRAILESPAKSFLCPDAQFVTNVLARHDVVLGPIAGDMAVASFLLNSERKTHDLVGLGVTWLQHKSAEPLEVAASPNLAAEPAHITWLLQEPLHEHLAKAEVMDVYRNIDLPVIPVLSRMQRNGILLDQDMLFAYGEELRGQARAAEEATWEHAGRKFNSASPKQLAEILFEELELPVIKRTRSGPSTDASVLEELASQHPLPRAILTYRSLSKLLSTYIDALPPLVNPETGRIHTHYSQTVAATGRLSSKEPNLQNIPIRTPEGRRIREAFVAAPGHVLVSADYSQVELRVLAHLCGGTGGFARAFAEDADVHRVTASEVFDTPHDEVTSAQRSAAKAVNFGLVYGQTDFGLSRSLHIPRAEAREYIARYKEKFPEIDRYMAETVEGAKRDRYVRTVTGRRRPVSDLTSNNYNQREAAKRVAINTPVQGTAADIIKLAMLRVDELLRTDFRDVRLLLQVHDELLLEVPEAQAEALTARVVGAMEAAYPLIVPLKVDTGVGRNWEEAH